jgi:hypothetical protein
MNNFGIIFSFFLLFNQTFKVFSNEINFLDCSAFKKHNITCVQTAGVGKKTNQSKSLNWGVHLPPKKLIQGLNYKIINIFENNLLFKDGLDKFFLLLPRAPPLFY